MAEDVQVLFHTLCEIEICRFEFFSVYIHVDVDECTTGLHNCIGLAQCVNDIGFFYCTCPEGYRLDDSQTSCTGINL